MKLSKLLFGAAALALLAGPVFAAGEPSDLKVTTINGKNVITDAKGMTLYTYDKDTAGVSNCYDKCAAAWPPAFATDGAAAAGDFSLVKRTDGKMMWAYDGKPVYTFIKDKKAGDMSGDGVADVWHVVKAN